MCSWRYVGALAEKSELFMMSAEMARPSVGGGVSRWWLAARRVGRLLSDSSYAT